MPKSRWVRKGIAKQTSIRTPQAIVRKLGREVVRLSGILQGIDKPHQFLGSVGNGNIVVLALGSFLSEISSKGWVPMANILGGVENSKPQVSGAAFLHMGIAVG